MLTHAEKQAHAERARRFAQAEACLIRAHVALATAELANTAIPGPLVSGVVSAEFSEDTKRKLRGLCGAMSAAQIHSWVSWSKAQKRRRTWLRMRNANAYRPEGE